MFQPMASLRNTAPAYKSTCMKKVPNQITSTQYKTFLPAKINLHVIVLETKLHQLKDKSEFSTMDDKI